MFEDESRIVARRAEIVFPAKHGAGLGHGSHHQAVPGGDYLGIGEWRDPLGTLLKQFSRSRTR